MTKEQLAKFGIVIEKDEITDEEANALIEQKFNSLNGEVKKHKDLLSTRNSEIAEYKRKEQEKLSEEEKTKLHYQELEQENANLKRDSALSKKVKDYIALGYSEELATKVANAELDGKSTTEYHKQFIQARDESIKAELLKQGSKPSTNGDPKPATIEDMKKMTYTELLNVKETNPELYAEFEKSMNNNN